MIKRSGVLIFSVLLAFTAPAHAQLADFEESTDSAVTVSGADVRKDVPYGPDKRQRIDIYAPPGIHNAPVIFMVHGGGWRWGDKTNSQVVRNKSAHWVSQGFIFISANYRMLPEADPLRQAEDVARALAFAQKNAASWGGDPSQFILMGHSAGAHLVMLLTANPAHAFQAGARPWRGTVSLDSGAIDVPEKMSSRHPRLHDQAFGSDENFWRMASPYHQLVAGATTSLMVCSTRRSDSCPQSHAYAERAQGLGVKVGVLEEDKSHRQINEDLGLPSPYTEAVDQFIRSIL